MAIDSVIKYQIDIDSIDVMHYVVQIPTWLRPFFENMWIHE